MVNWVILSLVFALASNESIQVEQNLMVPMRDGVRLATDGKGHRIRLEVSSSNFPRFDVNPNTGEPLGAHRRTMTAHNSIYHDDAHPSHVVLPIVPSAKEER